jgi:FkbM family methyltransferase
MKEIIITKLIKLFPRIFFNIFRKFYRKKLTYNLLNIISKGFNIKNVYDVGAHKGLWSKSLKDHCLKNSNFFLFEANLDHEKDLREIGSPYFINLLSDNIKEVKFYNNNNTGDSYFMENTNEYEEKSFVKKTTTTLDIISEKKNLPFPDLLKIDTQGSELDILKGGKETIKNCLLIYLECPIIDYNKNSPGLTEYINYLNLIGFIPYDICEVHRIDEVLIQIDILFIKKSEFNKINSKDKILNIFN